MTNIDAALNHVILHVPRRQRKSDIHQRDQADDVRQRIKKPERAWRFGSRFTVHRAGVQRPALAAAQVWQSPKSASIDLLAVVHA